MTYFCTLFDSNYLTRGLATYQSLQRVCDDAMHLYVFAFDQHADDTLRQMNLPNLTVISLAEFEDSALLRIKPERSRGEYCWTCTSSTIRFCLQRYDLPHCIYIDADMIFYQNPSILLTEIPENRHVMITEHRYTPQYDKSAISGKYCVQFMYFDNTSASLAVLNWWRDRCIEWCFNRHEDGKFGDQKYLDDWTTRFADTVYVMQHLGGGIAPWNVQQYEFWQEKGQLVAKEKTTGERFLPVFYHFHGVKFYERYRSVYAPRMYWLSNSVKRSFYLPYLQRIAEAKTLSSAYTLAFDPNGTNSSAQYRADRFKGWGAWFWTNILKQRMR